MTLAQDQEQQDQINANMQRKIESAQLLESLNKSAQNNQASLHQKIAMVQFAIGKALPQSGKHKDKGFEYLTHEDASGTIRPLCAKHGLTVLGKVVNTEFSFGEHNGKNKMTCTTWISLMLTDVETGETLEMPPVPGYAEAFGSTAAIQIASSYALKNALTTTFVAGSGKVEEPEPEITPEQIKVFRDTVKAQGFNTEGARAFLAHYGISKTTEIPAPFYDLLLREAQKNGAAEHFNALASTNRS
jgi:hypothetical protein